MLDVLFVFGSLVALAHVSHFCLRAALVFKALWGLSRSPFDLLSQSLQLNSSPDPWSRNSNKHGPWRLAHYSFPLCFFLRNNSSFESFHRPEPYWCCTCVHPFLLLLFLFLPSVTSCFTSSSLSPFLCVPFCTSSGSSLKFVLWLCRASQRPSPGPPDLRQLALQRKVKKKTLLPHVSPARPLLQTLLQTLLQAPAACNGSRLKSCWSAL